MKDYNKMNENLQFITAALIHKINRTTYDGFQYNLYCDNKERGSGEAKRKRLMQFEENNYGS